MTTEINGNVQSFFAEMHSFLQEVQDLGRTNHAETTTELRRILADIGREVGATLTLPVKRCGVLILPAFGSVCWSRAICAIIHHFGAEHSSWYHQT
ncbi:hypothetical protein M404DRAFT_532835 [Pisolithus tinctorius Marx 270]|uniref:Uncharacterized protein n=1 Tax=Pisolithus tinctorius Marx 270 TaxID=870435 RepID=A0A0C3PBJ3_PISTI|nr:hypothetical protein M404DRAFT_532835 [Pisolithus tinctorius Marx 270]